MRIRSGKGVLYFSALFFALKVGCTDFLLFNILPPIETPTHLHRYTHTYTLVHAKDALGKVQFGCTCVCCCCCCTARGRTSRFALLCSGASPRSRSVMLGHEPIAIANDSCGQGLDTFRPFAYSIVLQFHTTFTLRCVFALR